MKLARTIALTIVAVATTLTPLELARPAEPDDERLPGRGVALESGEIVSAIRKRDESVVVSNVSTAPGDAYGNPGGAGPFYSKILGRPLVHREVVYFTVPARPVGYDLDVARFSKVIGRVLRSTGFDGKPISTPFAIVLAELDETDFDGVAVHWSEHRLEACVSTEAKPLAELSTQLGWRWVDWQAAKSLEGRDADDVAKIRRDMKSLAAPETDAQRAIVAAAREAIAAFAGVLAAEAGAAGASGKLDVVVAGKRLPAGAAEVLADGLGADGVDLPFAIGSVKAADDPGLASVRGALIAALADGDEDR